MPCLRSTVGRYADLDRPDRLRQVRREGEQMPTAHLVMDAD